MNEWMNGRGRMDEWKRERRFAETAASPPGALTGSRTKAMSTGSTPS